jgi:hypothetical protein
MSLLVVVAVEASSIMDTDAEELAPAWGKAVESHTYKRLQGSLGAVCTSTPRAATFLKEGLNTLASRSGCCCG